MKPRAPAHGLCVLGSLCIVLVALVPSCKAETEASIGDVLGTLLRSPFKNSAEMNATYVAGKEDDFMRMLYALLPPTDGASNLEIIEKQLQWKHNLVLWVLPDTVRAGMPDIVQSWLANYILGSLLYLLLGAAWCFFTYVVFKNTRAGIREDNIPSTPDLLAQIKVSMGAIPLYTMLPPFAEYFIKNGYTLTYGKVESIGWGMYFVNFVLYMASVEFGVYWMHRSLHELKLGYKYLHSTHHVYNKENTLSPFAGLAFHPLDGILQAIPYVWTLALVPMHFLTHELLLFATAVWTTNIHDCVYGGGEPVMGAGYHLIHHTTYKHNYGHYLTVCDWLFNTLRTPEEHSKKTKTK